MSFSFFVCCFSYIIITFVLDKLRLIDTSEIANNADIEIDYFENVDKKLLHPKLQYNLFNYGIGFDYCFIMLNETSSTTSKI